MPLYGVVLQQEVFVQVEADDAEEAKLLVEQGQGREVNTDDVKVLDVFEVKY